MSLRTIALALLAEPAYTAISLNEETRTLRAVRGAADILIETSRAAPGEFTVVSRTGTVSGLVGYRAVLLHLGLPPLPGENDLKKTVLDFIRKCLGK
jgi:hypothetical protein